MQLEVIRSKEAFNALAGEWNELLTCCSASHVPFLRHEYLAAWWETLGGGEWKQGELFVIVGRYDNGELGAIAPMFFTENRDRKPALMLLGSIEISDYLDFIVPPSELDAFTQSLFQLLKGDQAPPWGVLDFYNLLEDSATIAALDEASRKESWTFLTERLQPCPYVDLPDEWNAYLSGLKKKNRHEIRRKLRRAERYEKSVRWYIMKDESSLDREIESFMDLMGQDPQKESFLTPTMRKQMRAIAHAAFRAGWLQLAFLEVGDEKAAAYLNFDYANQIWVYNSGIDFKFRELSPGWVLLSYLLQWTIENKRTRFDFMRGAEDYKYRFGGVERFVTRVQIHR